MFDSSPTFGSTDRVLGTLSETPLISRQAVFTLKVFTSFQANVQPCKHIPEGQLVVKLHATLFIISQEKSAQQFFPVQFVSALLVLSEATSLMRKTKALGRRGLEFVC